MEGGLAKISTRGTLSGKADLLEQAGNLGKTPVGKESLRKTKHEGWGNLEERNNWGAKGGGGADQ